MKVVFKFNPKHGQNVDGSVWMLSHQQNQRDVRPLNLGLESRKPGPFHMSQITCEYWASLSISFLFKKMATKISSLCSTECNYGN